MSQNTDLYTYVEVLLPLPIEGLFTYKIPTQLSINQGDLLIVPFGNAKSNQEDEGHLQIACAYRLLTQDPCPNIRKKFVISVLKQLPNFPNQLLQFLSKLSRYYHISWGEALKLALPTTRLQKVMLPSAKGKIAYEELSLKPFDDLSDTEKSWLKLYPILLAQPIHKNHLPYTIAPTLIESWEKETQWISQIPLPYLGDEWDWLIQSMGQTLIHQNKSKRQEIELMIKNQKSIFLKQFSEKYSKNIIKKTIEDLYFSHQIDLKLQYQAYEIEEKQADDQQYALEITLNAEQIYAIDMIKKSKDYQGFLLYGITGSGKTEVYLEVIADVLAQGKNALVLVPEIGLTPQTLRRFRKRFGDCVEIWHSQKTAKERFQTLSLLKKEKNLVLIGTRSALFCPLKNIGIVIVDEAHDPSYKQGEGIKYHARDMSLLRGQIEKCPVILGSATPSLENIYHVQLHKLTLLKLTQRPGHAILPKVKLIDLKTAYFPVPDAPFLSYPLLDAIRQRLNTCEQTILFLNRRGFSESLRCIRCGFVFKCQNCNIAQTWHQKANELKCHYCLKAMHVPASCPDCHAMHDYVPIGKGTEKVEDQLHQIFPKARIFRLDRDSEEGFEDFERKMRNQEIDIVIGTQMVSKGHDFPAVTLVGILDADKGLDLPDFRAAERVYQLLSQVAGRAGRADKPGEVLIQTYRPEDPFLQTIVQHNFDLFCEQELNIRSLIGYPPFSFAVLLRIEHEQLSKINQTLDALNQFLSFKQQTIMFQKRGPMAAPLSMIANRFRFITFLLFRKREHLHELVDTLKKSFMPTSAVPISIDIDPIDFF
jgi:primosomal protein N' (replication factor Y)